MGRDARDLYRIPSGHHRRKKKLPIRSLVVSILRMRVPGTLPRWQESCIHLLFHMAAIWDTVLEIFQTRHRYLASVLMLLHCYLTVGGSLVSGPPSSRLWKGLIETCTMQAPPNRHHHWQCNWNNTRFHQLSSLPSNTLPVVKL